MLGIDVFEIKHSGTTSFHQRSTAAGPPVMSRLALGGQDEHACRHDFAPRFSRSGRLELDQLRYFLRVADQGNYTRAAEQLSISQSALSRSIQRLEEEIGQPVFERQSRGLLLTESGKLLQKKAAQAIDILDAVKGEITDDGQTGRIRVGAIPTVAPFFLPGLLKQFSAAFPHANLIVQEQTTDVLLKSCSQGEIDLAILAMPVEAKYLEIQSLFDEELLLVLPVDHPLVAKTQIEIGDIDRLPFVLLGETHCLADNIVSFCRRQSFHPVSVERTSQISMVQELVALSHGVSMIPAMARRCDHSDQRIYRSIGNPPPIRTIAMAWNPYRFESRLNKAFREAAAEYSKTFGSSKAVDAESSS